MTNSDSDFWREFAASFQALSTPYSDLRADWTYVLKSGTLGDWRIVGDVAQRSQFESLARRAAIRLPEKRCTDLLVAWLTALKETSISFRMMGVTAAEIGPNYMMGSIARLGEASANFCRKLESNALQSEYEDAQQKTGPAAPEASASHDEREVERRQRLLAEYKSATRNPSNKRIYEAVNSGIHKPQFYEWLRGKLPSESATTQNFERFLREKKPPSKAGM